MENIVLNERELEQVNGGQESLLRLSKEVDEQMLNCEEKNVEKNAISSAPIGVIPIIFAENGRAASDDTDPEK